MPKIIKDIGSTKRLISPEKVAKALGAKDTGVKINTRQGPISLFPLRQILVKEIRPRYSYSIASEKIHAAEALLPKNKEAFGTNKKVIKQRAKKA